MSYREEMIETIKKAIVKWEEAPNSLEKKSVLRALKKRLKAFEDS
jgi:hypothetical protein